MRSVGALLVAAVAVAASAAPASPGTPPMAPLVPNSVTFFDRAHGVLGSGYQYCDSSTRCRPAGAISLTTDGGRTWRVVLHTRRPVVSVLRYGSGDVVDAVFDDGTTLQSGDGGHHWHTALALSPYGESLCPQGMNTTVNSEAYGSDDWALCTGQPGAGNQGKAVYRLGARGWTRVAYTPMGPPQHGYGGITSNGYGAGIAGSESGFGVIWEDRGTLFVTRDGGRHWTGLWKLSLPDFDFDSWAYVLPHGGVGWAILFRGGNGPQRLLETTDAGRSWHVVHRWPKLSP